MILMENEIQVTLLGDAYCIFKSILTAGKEFLQFLFAFQIEIIGRKPHPVFIIHTFARLNAQQNILHLGILPAQVVGIIGDHKRQPCFPGDAADPLVHSLLLAEAVILKL